MNDGTCRSILLHCFASVTTCSTREQNNTHLKDSSKHLKHEGRQQTNLFPYLQCKYLLLSSVISLFQGHLNSQLENWNKHQHNTIVCAFKQDHNNSTDNPTLLYLLTAEKTYCREFNHFTHLRF